MNHRKRRITPLMFMCFVQVWISTICSSKSYSKMFVISFIWRWDEFFWQQVWFFFTVIAFIHEASLYSFGFRCDCVMLLIVMCNSCVIFGSLSSSNVIGVQPWFCYVTWWIWFLLLICIGELFWFTLGYISGSHNLAIVAAISELQQNWLPHQVV